MMKLDRNFAAVALLLVINVQQISCFRVSCSDLKWSAFVDPLFIGEYKTPKYPDGWEEYYSEFYSAQGYGKFERCSVTIEFFYKGDVVELKVVDADLPPADNSGSCADVARVYDGYSSSAPLLGTICGSSKPTFVSSGSALFLTFDSDGNDDRSYRGVKAHYQALDRGGKEDELLKTLYLPLFLSIGGVVFVAVLIIICCVCLCRRARKAQEQRVASSRDAFHSRQNYDLAMQNLQFQNQQQSQPLQYSYQPPAQAQHHQGLPHQTGASQPLVHPTAPPPLYKDVV